jgi:MFS family permease
MKPKILSPDTALIMLATLFYMASTMIINPLITGYSEELGASGTIMGLVGGLSNLLALFCRPFVGNWTDRFSKFKLSMLGAALMLTACVGYVFAPNMAVVVMARLCNGMGFACCSVSMSTWMSALLPKDQIASGMGLYGTINALSMAVAPVIGVRLRNNFGYKAAFLGAAVCALFMLVVIPFVGDKGEPVVVAREKTAELSILRISA